MKGAVIGCGITGLTDAIAKEENEMQDNEDSLIGLERRYPAKTYYLGQVFNNTTNSYKLVWFLGILSLLKQNDTEKIEQDDIFIEMAVMAWHPVCLYILSLGRQDKLQEFITEICDQSNLAANASPAEIRRWISGSEETRTKLRFFRRYVPTRFLTPWFSDALRGVQDDIQRTNIITDLAKTSQKEANPTPYWLEGDSIILNAEWLNFLKENLGIVEAFARHNFALYLQARNPSIPGIINKLTAPSTRRLNAARQFWTHVQKTFLENDKSGRFVDIYSGKPISQDFSIDHFLPWSFVVHDLFWNLTPVDSSTNSSKSNSLPDLDLYLPELAKLHYEAVSVSRNHPRFLEDYLDCFKTDLNDLLAMNVDGFVRRYREVIAPQTQIAINQGFQHGWRHQEN